MSLRIGELAARTGVKIETIRWYERVGLVAPPARTDANYRTYDAAAVARLALIRCARDLGFSLDQICELPDLSSNRERGCEALARHANSNGTLAAGVALADAARSRSRLFVKRKIIPG